MVFLNCGLNYSWEIRHETAVLFNVFNFFVTRLITPIDVLQYVTLTCSGM